MTTARYQVTRLPGAPPRRAGRVWPVETPVNADLTAVQVALIAADPGYLLAPVAAPIPLDAPRPAKAGRRRT
ncbi:hypothetical protein [uncultured Lamprocystis sp.]|jgi:hypothetical protein|uniref:hypothetical protein n=1 Tax=uncultured Lamprocystis sp. TaxID=543132 RepID=UPI0025D0C81F|nr:hypothetical protein [uncultured Lamprocystis sp.]